MRVDKLERTTYRIVGILLLLAIVIGCGLEREEPFDGDPEFRMSAPARLYFANVRSAHYYYERPRGTDLDVYRLKTLSQTTARPMLLPLIVQAYLNDEAYLFIKPNAYEGVQEPLSVRLGLAADAARLNAGSGSRHDQRVFGDSLRAAVLRGDSLYLVLSDGRLERVLAEAQDKAAFLTVLQDYHTLIARGGKAARQESR